jgi:general nucleoside transport system permease protein
MQREADLGTDIVRIVQALILLFVAADLLIRRVFRLRAEDGEPRTALASGWGG